MTVILRLLLGLAVATFLSACGNDPHAANTTPRFLAKLAARVTGRSGEPAPSSAALITSDQRVLAMRIDRINVASAMRLAGTNGRHETYMTSDRISVTFDAGVIIATRGMAQDLMGLELQGPGANHFRGIRSQTSQRSYRYLGPENQALVLDVTCILTRGGQERVVISEKPMRLQRFDESCTGAGLTFQNIYWLDPASRAVRKSTQWISPAIGTLSIEVLLP